MTATVQSIDGTKRGRELLNVGIYTVPQAARLVQISPAKVRGWVTGYPGTSAQPIVRNQLRKIDSALAIGFQNLLEVRFIKRFSGYGVSIQGIRAIAQEAREFLDHPHPFATSVIFKTDGRKIFAEAAERSGDKRLYDLKEKNWAMHDVIAQSLKDDVHYDPAGEAEYWRPRKAIAPDVVVNPKRSFGQPIIEPAGIPTATLYRAFEAEGSMEEVARWFDIEPAHVNQAVRFELELLAEAA